MSEIWKKCSNFSREYSMEQLYAAVAWLQLLAVSQLLLSFKLLLISCFNVKFYFFNYLSLFQIFGFMSLMKLHNIKEFYFEKNSRKIHFLQCVAVFSWLSQLVVVLVSSGTALIAAVLTARRSHCTAAQLLGLLLLLTEPTDRLRVELASNQWGTSFGGLCTHKREKLQSSENAWNEYWYTLASSWIPWKKRTR